MVWLGLKHERGAPYYELDEQLETELLTLAGRERRPAAEIEAEPVVGSCPLAQACRKSSPHHYHGLGGCKAVLLPPALQLDNSLMRGYSVMPS